MGRSIVVVDVVARRTQLSLALLHRVVILVESSLYCLRRAVIVRILKTETSTRLQLLWASIVRLSRILLIIFKMFLN